MCHSQTHQQWIIISRRAVKSTPSETLSEGGEGLERNKKTDPRLLAGMRPAVAMVTASVATRLCVYDGVEMRRTVDGAARREAGPVTCGDPLMSAALSHCWTVSQHIKRTERSNELGCSVSHVAETQRRSVFA